MRTICQIIALLIFSAAASDARGGAIFSDDFDSGSSPLWGNERGNWTDAGGVYSALAPSNNPLTVSTLPFELTDFELEVDINDIADGGIYLRRDANENGILLVTGGGASFGTGLYWHTMANNGAITGTFGVVTNLFTSGVDDVHLRVVVSGDTYSVYVNGSATPATTLTNSDYPSGRVGLYDRSVQTFDNLVLTPEPASVVLFGACGIALVRRRRK